MTRLQLAIGQITLTREYTLELLDQTPSADWFKQPLGVTHIAWQVGHLAFAEYRLALWRIRDVQPGDDALFPPDFVRLFGAESVPAANPELYPEAAAIRATLDRVHAQVLEELNALNEDELDAAVAHPRPFANTKLPAILWCARHEMLHAGQIGLLRRQLGHPPL